MVRIRDFCCRSIIAVAVPAIVLTAASPPLLGQQTRVEERTDAVDLEVLMRGPVHEGFAEPAVESRGFLELADVAPDPIEELPAEVRPIDDGRNVTWVPGYWGIEGEADELVWISGTWRYAPPNTRWVPGYWATLDEGSVWVSGFWIDDSLERVEYLPAPPPVDSFEPTVEAPGDGYFWVPGNYVWTGTRYVWEEGFWAEAQPHWTWVPARYVWTPRGYVFVEGYWDYPVERRGVLFAPVRLATTYREVYRPRVAISIPQALVHWFVRPDYHHYYFGNYYGDRYQRIGFTPWVAYTQQPTYYDPLYSYYRANRVDYLQTLVQAHQRVATLNATQLPVRYSAFRQLAAGSPQQTEVAQLMNFARPVDQLLTQGATGEGEIRFERLSDSDQAEAQIEQYREQIQSVRQFARGRAEAEVDASASVGDDLRARARATQSGQDQQDARRAGDEAADPSQTPRAGDTPDQSPDRADATDDDQPATRPGRDQADRPGRDQADQPGRDQADRPGRDQADQPGRDQVDRPGRDEADRPGRDQADRPGRDQADQPGRDQADRPGRDQADRPGRDQADRPGRDQADQPGRDQADRPQQADPSNLLDRVERGRRGDTPLRGDAQRSDVDRPRTDQPGEAAERSRGSFDLGPFRGSQRAGDRSGDRRARGEARRTLDQVQQPTERGDRDTADAIRDAARDRNPQRSEAAPQRRLEQPGRAGGRIDADRPPPLLSRPGARGQVGRPGAPGRGDSGDASPGTSRPGAGATRGERSPARRPGEATPGSGARPGAGTPGAGTPGAGTPPVETPGGATPGAGTPSPGAAAGGSAAAGGGGDADEGDDD